MKVVNYNSEWTERSELKIDYLRLRFSDNQRELNYKGYKSNSLNSIRKKSLSLTILWSQQILFSIYLVSYIIKYNQTQRQSTLNFQLTLMILIILAVFLIIFLDRFRIIKIKYKSISFLYLISSLVLILNDNGFQGLVFSNEIDLILTSLPGLLCLSILYRCALNYRSLIIYNPLICTLHSVLSLVQSGSNTVIFENVILVFIFIYFILYNYFNELEERKHFILTSEIQNENENEIENFNSLSGLHNGSSKLQVCIDDLTKIIPRLRSDLKPRIEKIIKYLKSTFASLKNQDTSSVIKNLTNELDQEDKVYFQESFLPVKIIGQKSFKRFQQRYSVDKIIQTVLSKDTTLILKEVGNNWNINIFQINETTDNRVISVLGKYTMKLYNLIDIYNIPDLKISYFFNEIQNKYKSNPYHNSIHGADVLCSGLYIITNSDMSGYLSDLDILIIIISFISHDVGHPGLTNRFLINAQDSLALNCKRYIDNDNSVLENMHCSIVFTALSKPDKNITETVPQDQFLVLRKWVIELILSTDMAKHFEFLPYFKSKGYSPSDLEDDGCRLETLKLIIKCSDIGHSAKVSELHCKWSELITEEFFIQGDIEKANNRPVSMYCDRDTTFLPKTQIGFLKNIALPLFELLLSHLKSDKLSSECLDQIKSNIFMWEYKSSISNIKSLDEKDLINSTSSKNLPRPLMKNSTTKINNPSS